MGQKVQHVESYKDQIDNNKRSLKEVLKHTKDTIGEIRVDIETEKMKSLKEFQALQKSMQKYINEFGGVPIMVESCLHKCKFAEDTSNKVTHKVIQLESFMMGLDANKTSTEEFG